MRAIDVATMSIGQGIAVTPLQMVQAYSALANGGQMVKPHIIKEIKNPDGSDYKVNQTEISGNPVSKEVADEVKDMMEKEVASGGGTNAQVDGYHMAGKTGTAQKIDAVNGGYLKTSTSHPSAASALRKIQGLYALSYWIHQKAYTMAAR